MTSEISHRGPDGRGFLENGPIALGHARLSVIDLTDNGKQPMVEEGKAVIAFNGEIYNFIELREELQRLGFQFRGKSDTEVILHGYIYWV